MRRFVLVLSLLLATPAAAIDFGRVLTLDDGKPVCSIDTGGAPCPDGKELTLRMAARNALRAPFPDERETVSGDEKYRREELGRSIGGVGDIKLKVEDIALIKKLIAKLYGPVVVYEAWNALDPKDSK